jgi:hypothetical protein
LITSENLRYNNTETIPSRDETEDEKDTGMD